MKIAKDLVVSIAYQVRTEDGVLVDEAPLQHRWTTYMATVL
jgi:hypothetical protein